jgi:ribokinase
MKPIVILGIFVADTAYRAERQPKMGETILGQSPSSWAGGQGVEPVRCRGDGQGAEDAFHHSAWADAFADIARATWAKAGVVPR